MNDPRYQDIRSGEVAAADLRRRRRRWCASSPAPSTATPARARRSPRCRWCTPASSPAPASTCRGTSTSTRSSTCSTAAAPSAPTRVRSTPASPRCSAPATTSRSPPTRRQESRSPKLDVIVVGGRPIREPLAWAGPFVMNTKSEVMQAYEDFQKRPLRAHPRLTGFEALATCTHGPDLPRRVRRPARPGRPTCSTCPRAGQVTARDRAWQLEYLRRRATGTTAEVFGAPQAAPGTGRPAARPDRRHRAARARRADRGVARLRRGVRRRA